MSSSSEDKLKIVKNYKLTPEILQLFENALKDLQEKPIQTVSLPNGEVKISNSDQMQRVIQIGLLSLLMNLATMKNSLAVHIEHELNEEITTDKLEAMMNQAMSKLGKFKGMLGEDI